jgi:small ligand-binding sensory domain FIST
MLAFELIKWDPDHGCQKQLVSSSQRDPGFSFNPIKDLIFSIFGRGRLFSWNNINAAICQSPLPDIPDVGYCALEIGTPGFDGS